jgi:subtilase family serine protease
VSVNPGSFRGRGVPDVAGDADPSSGYQVRVDGRDAVFGGTSAVAPLWAALIALVNQRRGRPLGFLNPLLYPGGARGCRDITAGNNGAFNARTGWMRVRVSVHPMEPPWQRCSVRRLPPCNDFERHPIAGNRCADCLFAARRSPER